MKQKLFLLLAALLLTGCADRAEEVSRNAETVSAEDYHQGRYTDEQKSLLEYWWGKEWDTAVTDGMIESALVGTGCETGHKTTGIAMGFSYQGSRSDIPEETGDKILTYGIVEEWEKEGKEFRLEEIVPYRHTVEWNVDISGLEHAVDWDMEAEEWNPSGFRITFPMDYVQDGSCEMKITGGVSEGRILIINMSVVFEDAGGNSYGGSIYHHMNYIRSVFEDEGNRPEQIGASVMSGSADKEGCYLVVTNGTEGEYKISEKALLDGKELIEIKRINGDAIAGVWDIISAKMPRMDFYVEWDSLTPGEHELTVIFTDENGNEKQVTVPFVNE
ncbi:MAG: hypothetical protein NC489_32435 [Ruminococcus flavefaciens]|nr:hypothetical protein [Ruminococcus flavefaciens]